MNTKVEINPRECLWMADFYSNANKITTRYLVKLVSIKFEGLFVHTCYDPSKPDFEL